MKIYRLKQILELIIEEAKYRNYSIFWIIKELVKELKS